MWRHASISLSTTIAELELRIECTWVDLGGENTLIAILSNYCFIWGLEKSPGRLKWTNLNIKFKSVSGHLWIVRLKCPFAYSSKCWWTWWSPYNREICYYASSFMSSVLSVLTFGQLPPFGVIFWLIMMWCQTVPCATVTLDTFLVSGNCVHQSWVNTLHVYARCRPVPLCKPT